MKRWLAFVFLVACGGQTTSDDAGSEAGGVDAPFDAFLSPSDACDGDPSLTGNHVLSLLKPLYVGTFVPQNGGQPSQLQLFLSYANGPIICTRHQVSNGGPPDTPASIALAVTAQFFTADGLFAEKFDATVVFTANTPDTSLAFIGTISTSSIQGTYKPTIGGSWTQHALSFSGTLVFPPTFDAGQDNGSTSGNVMEQASNGNMGQVTSAGSWN